MKSFSIFLLKKSYKVVKIFTLLDKRLAFLIEARSLFSFTELLLLPLLLSNMVRMKNECQINNVKISVQHEST